MPIVRLSGVEKSFVEGGRQRPVLRRLDLAIEKGECIVILGRSGSGKTTLLNLMSGIDQPDAGLVEVAGLELSKMNERDRTLFRRRRIGFIFQFFNLIPTLTVEENLLLPLELRGDVTEKERKAALGWLDAVGLADRAGGYPDRLSGGEQQRVAIARALSHDPDLLLADEPTGNLDLETGRRVLDLLDKLAEETGKTMVMVTHSNEVVGLADRVLTFREGRLEENLPAVP
jgi:putative ABC transport system ATP-binding protein